MVTRVFATMRRESLPSVPDVLRVAVTTWLGPRAVKDTRGGAGSSAHPRTWGAEEGQKLPGAPQGDVGPATLLGDTLPCWATQTTEVALTLLSDTQDNRS